MRKPWLWLSPQLAHDLVPWALPVAATLFPKNNLPYKPFDWRGLHFQNPLGIAGGVDKSGSQLKHWQKLGCGFLEVGTITPQPQMANPGKILNRSLKHKAVWNKMGFPNQGAEVCLQQLQNFFHDKKVPLFANIGKNRSTENANAHRDYIHCMDRLRDNADAFVINISSPNTQGLRELLSKTYLHSFFEALTEYKARTNLTLPLLLKLSPDLQPSELQSVLDITYQLGIDGWILTNTTVWRPQGLAFPVEGGLSGAPLKNKSIENLKLAVDHLGSKKNDKLIVSAGGVSSAADVLERLRLGANLVQIYSALIFEGPLFFQNTVKQLQTHV